MRLESVEDTGGRWYVLLKHERVLLGVGAHQLVLEVQLDVVELLSSCTRSRKKIGRGGGDIEALKAQRLKKGQQHSFECHKRGG